MQKLVSESNNSVFLFIAEIPSVRVNNVGRHENERKPLNGEKCVNPLLSLKLFIAVCDHS